MLFLDQNFLLILKKQELVNSEHVALSYDDFVVLRKIRKIENGRAVFGGRKKM